MYAPTVTDGHSHTHAQPSQSPGMPIRHNASPSISSMTTIRADPFLVHHRGREHDYEYEHDGSGDHDSPHRYPYPYTSVPYTAYHPHPHYHSHSPSVSGPSSGSGSGVIHHSHTFPPVPPARTSSLPSGQHGHGHGPGSPSTRRVPSVQVIHPTPTKKKGRPRSTASGETAKGSPRVRGRQELGMSDDQMGGLKAGSHNDDVDAAGLDHTQHPETLSREEAKKARAREKGRERQRRKRERDKKAREMLMPSSSSSNLTSSLPMSVPSSASSTYSSLPHSHSFSLSPNQSFAFSASSTSLSGTSSPNVLFSPVVSSGGTHGNAGAGDILWTTAGKSSKPRRPSAAPSMTHISPPPKRRKSELEIDEALVLPNGTAAAAGVGLGVSWPTNDTGHEDHDGDTIRYPPRPKPRRTISMATETTETSLQDTSSEWPRSPTPPPVGLPLETMKAGAGRSGDNSTPAPTSQGQFFASLVVLACEAPGVAAALQSQLQLGTKEMDGLRDEIGAVYDRWAKGLEVDMGAVTLNEKVEMASPGAQTFTPNRPRAGTQVNIPINTHTRTRSLSSASMLARGLVLNPNTTSTGITTSTSTWDSPQRAPGSDSPTQSNLQTPSTGQGTSFVIPNQPVPVDLGAMIPSQTQGQTQGQIQGQQHYRSQTEPGRKEWRSTSAAAAALDSPLAVSKSRVGGVGLGGQRGQVVGTGGDGGIGRGLPDLTKPPSDPTSTPPHAVPMSSSHMSTATPTSVPPPHQLPYHISHEYHPVSHAMTGIHPHAQPFPQPIFVPSYPTPTAAGPSYIVPYTPTASAPRGVPPRPAPLPFTPPTPMPLRGGGEAPMWYQASFLAHQTPTHPSVSASASHVQAYTMHSGGIMSPVTATHPAGAAAPMEMAPPSISNQTGLSHSAANSPVKPKSSSITIVPLPVGNVEQQIGGGGDTNAGPDMTSGTTQEMNEAGGMSMSQESVSVSVGVVGVQHSPVVQARQDLGVGTQAGMMVDAAAAAEEVFGYGYGYAQ